MKRIFIAVRVEPDELFMNMFSGLKEGLRSDNIKWTDPANIHLTLVFLGDTAEKRVEEIGSLLEDHCGSTGDFELVIRGAGVFKSADDPRIIWAGIDRCEKLLQLNKTITSLLRESGSSIEQRSFKPHLTLGRIKNIKNISALKLLLEEYQGMVIQVVKVADIILYESILLASGPRYKPLGIYKIS